MNVTLTDLPDHLRAWGLDVVAVTGWQDRRRPGLFNPIGVLVHHTAGPKGKDAPSLQVCIDGRADLPGPLCQLLVARSGKVYVISSNRCNHAGAGGPLAGLIGVDQGNTQLVGIEAENDGVSEPWPPKQLNAMAATAAAVLDLLGRPRAHCWAHREYTPRKPDPRGIDMGQFRSAVATARPPGATMPTTPASDAMVEQWQRMLLDNGARLGDAGPNQDGADGLFGRLTLEASKVILDHRNQLLKSFDEALVLGRKAETAVANLLARAEAAEARVAELQQRLTAALAGSKVDVDAALRIVHDLERQLGGDGA